MDYLDRSKAVIYVVELMKVSVGSPWSAAEASIRPISVCPALD